MKKRFLTLLLITAATCLLLAGCGTSKSDSAGSATATPATVKNITGTWVMEKANNKSVYQMLGNSVSASVTLNADGTGRVTYTIPKNASGDYSGTYPQTADTLTISSPDLDDDVSLSYSVDDNGLLNLKYKGYTVKLTKQ